MPEQTHLLTREFKEDSDVQVAFSVNPARKAILFIHGYSGDALKTWTDFPDLLRQNPKFAGHDLYFYGYDGLRAPIGASASIFRQFLEKLFGNTEGVLNANLPPTFQREAGFQYDDFLIVAHSLGAVVARRVLVDATKKNLSWVHRTRLVLYAPAHMGARIGQLALEAVSSFSFLGWFSGAARIVSPLIDELNPEKSDLLAKLQQATLDLCSEGQNVHLIARKVVWAERENVVSNQDFGNDPLGHAIKGTTHTSVCKPNAGFRAPLACLEECL
ncbi:MAG TPA: hypothetical protein PKE55_02355 [Kiritimatiellia bacterium]|nr:hypothetical protein [Kiritimatiellia bacterium]